jgi:Big-like domain-containing protein
MFYRLTVVLGVAFAAGACTNTDSFTNLNPDGPPAIAQVRMKESYMDASMATLTRRVFGFGTHPAASSDEEHAVTSASASGQTFRIIVDELLVGNALEEIQCRAPVDDDAFDSVPLGATPDDIAKCSGPSDSLKLLCSGPHAVCLCHIDGGCGTVAKGDPVGVLDVNADGAADNTSFKKGAVGIKCGQIDVPIDLDMSYWNPSGDQQVPAMGGFDALGPAIVLTPTGGFLPTNITCGFTFASDVLDKQGNEVCAPPDGRPPECDQWPPNLASDPAACTAKFECNPGDMSAFSFKTEPLSIKVQAVADGDTGVDPALPIFANVNTAINPATLTNVTITPAPPGGFTVTAPMMTQIKITFTTPLAAATMYTLTIPVSVTDTFGQGLPAPIIIHFTTA